MALASAFPSNLSKYPCPMEHTLLGDGYWAKTLRNDWNGCGQDCQFYPQCEVWSFNPLTLDCWLFESDTGHFIEDAYGWISGSKDCPSIL